MARTLDRFELMKLLVRIAETGSLSAAGRSLGLSQPSASRQLRILETEIGTQLVLRTTHELSFTEAGREFLNRARDMLASWDSAVEQAGSSTSMLSGQIRIAAPMGLGQTLAADVAAGFVAAHPGVTLDWILLDEPRDLVAEGIDVWIRVGPVRDENLIVRKLCNIDRVIVSARDDDKDIQHPKDLDQRPSIVLGPYVGAQLEMTGPRDERFVLRPAAKISTDNIFVAERLMMAEHGYSILPIWMVQSAIRTGHIHAICTGWYPPQLSLSVAYPQSRFRPARVRAFIDYVRETLTLPDNIELA